MNNEYAHVWRVLFTALIRHVRLTPPRRVRTAFTAFTAFTVSRDDKVVLVKKLDELVSLDSMIQYNIQMVSIGPTIPHY